MESMDPFLEFFKKQLRGAQNMLKIKNLSKETREDYLNTVRCLSIVLRAYEEEMKEKEKGEKE